MEKKRELFREVVDQISKCTKCTLHKERKNVVPGEGDINTVVMFVGEGPGADEDEQGRPFVGRSGMLLTKIIESVGFKRSDVYITNVVKCRPPGNRNPVEGEMKACSGYLEAQIALIQPRIIVTVGSVPTKWILRDELPGKEGITKLRGKFFTWRGMEVMPIFHPSYLLRNPSVEKGKPKWTTWQDMKLIKERCDEILKEGSGGRT